MLSNTLRLEFCYLSIIHVFHPRYRLKVIGHTLKNKQKNKCVCIYEIIQLITMKTKKKKKNRSHRYDMNRPTIIIVIFRDFLMFYQIFLSPQVKRSTIIIIYRQLCELPNDLRLTLILGYQERSGKSKIFVEL